jgi:hypothetical protein
VHKGEALITTQQAAQILGWNVATVNKQAKAGRLPVALKVPGRTGANLFRRDEIERLATERAA